jgi:hypothetical protein
LRYILFNEVALAKLTEKEKTNKKRRNLNGDFMSLFLTHPDFRNSAEEFHPHKIFSTPMKFLSSLSSLIRCHISIINVHETLMKPH